MPSSSLPAYTATLPVKANAGPTEGSAVGPVRKHRALLLPRVARLPDSWTYKDASLSLAWRAGGTSYPGTSNQQKKPTPFGAGV